MVHKDSLQYTPRLFKQKSDSSSSSALWAKGHFSAYRQRPGTKGGTRVVCLVHIKSANNLSLECHITGHELWILIMLFTQTFWEDSTTKPSFEPFRSAVLVTSFAHILSWEIPSGSERQSQPMYSCWPLPTHQYAPVSWNRHNFVLRNCPTLALCWLQKF